MRPPAVPAMRCNPSAQRAHAFTPAPQIVDKYIGESARLVREMFAYAREHEPCIIFMDEIDAIGGRRFSEGTSADREVQRTLMEVRRYCGYVARPSTSARLRCAPALPRRQLLNQMDGFDSLGRTKLIMATNRPDTLDPALLRPGRLDRKIEIPLPNEQARMEILKIHAKDVNKSGEIDYEAVVKVGASPGAPALARMADVRLVS